MAKVLVFLDYLDPRENIAQACRLSTVHKYVIHTPRILRPDPKRYAKNHLPLIEQFKRLLVCLALSWRSLFYDVVILREATMAMFISPFLMWRKKPKIVVLHFNILRRRKGGWVLISRLLLRRIDHFIVHSRYDLDFAPELYKLPRKHFTFLPYVRTAPIMGKLKELAITDNSKPYIMSYGINARDYHTLFEAVQGISLQVVVVARKFNIEGLEIPNNVKVLYNISLHECDKLVSNCLFTVFTFDGTEPSCGQISIVTSFMLGKPVICTDWIAVKDYVINDVNGLLVKMGNAEDLRNKMLKLFKDQKLYSCLSVGAQNWSKQHTDKLALQQSIDEVVTRLISPNDHNNVR